MTATSATLAIVFMALPYTARRRPKKKPRTGGSGASRFHWGEPGFRSVWEPVMAREQPSRSIYHDGANNFYTVDRAFFFCPGRLGLLVTCRAFPFQTHW